ncbi:MAG: hypothetical protein KBG84_13775 [Planctomycetes bacterium]|nr:hypothetical protein [Planctomycetota bacterium]
MAALALDQVGAETSDAEIARYLDIWLTRINDERAEANDEKVANSFLRLRSWADLQRMPVSDKAREILPALPILGGTRYYNEHVEGYSTEELAALSLPPGGAARRAALQMFVADRVPIEYVDRVTGALAAALDAARQRAFPAEPDSRSRVQFELERLAVYLTCPDNRRRGAKGLGWFTEAEAFRDLDNATWSYLRSHPNIVVRQSAAAIQAHPFTDIGSDPPANEEDLKYWLFRRGHTFRGDDKEAVDLFLSTKPERVPALPVDEYTSTFRHSHEDDYNDAWFLPCFGGTKNGLPRHWLTFATSSRRDLHFHFYKSIEGVDRDGFNALEGQDKEYFSEVMKCVHRDANGSDLMFKWLARRWLVLYEHLSATDRDGSMNVALRYVDELADDLLKQPRIAPVWYHIARPAAEALCKAAGADYYGEPQSAAHLGSPRWQLLCRLLENSPIFDSKGVWPPEHPEWLTLAEMRKLETEPAAFWRELQRDYAALPK